MSLKFRGLGPTSLTDIFFLAQLYSFVQEIFTISKFSSKKYAFSSSTLIAIDLI